MKLIPPTQPFYGKTRVWAFPADIRWLCHLYGFVDVSVFTEFMQEEYQVNERIANVHAVHADRSNLCKYFEE